MNKAYYSIIPVETITPLIVDFTWWQEIRVIWCNGTEARILPSDFGQYNEITFVSHFWKKRKINKNRKNAVILKAWDTLEFK